VVNENGEVLGEKLYLPLRKDKYGKVYCKLFSKFPEDFISVPYGSLQVNLGAFSIKFINPNLSEDEVLEDLSELVGCDISVYIKFKLLKFRSGMREVSVIDFVPAGTSGKSCASNIVFPLNPTGFGDVSCEVKKEENQTVLIFPEGEAVIDFPLPVREGRTVFSYGISQLVLRKVTEKGESTESFNLLAVF
jgi:predicted nucleic acid binding AN1-type Zn finger protein